MNIAPVQTPIKLESRASCSVGEAFFFLSVGFAVVTECLDGFSVMRCDIIIGAG